MTILSGLDQRRRQPEVMDEPDIDPDLHDAALRGLERINVISRSAAIVWDGVAEFARRHGGRPLRVLDLACGAGDVAVSLARRAAKAGLPVQVSGCDFSPHAIAYAREKARRANADVTFFPLDVQTDPLPDGYDVMTCSLFLHHLDEGPAESLLRQMGRASRLVLVNDLERGRLGYAMAWLGCRLLSRSPVVHIDGPRSVEAAFSREEARLLAVRAGLLTATVQRRWPWRFLLRWERP